MSSIASADGELSHSSGARPCRDGTALPVDVPGVLGGERLRSASQALRRSSCRTPKTRCSPYRSTRNTSTSRGGERSRHPLSEIREPTPARIWRGCRPRPAASPPWRATTMFAVRRPSTGRTRASESLMRSPTRNAMVTRSRSRTRSGGRRPSVRNRIQQPPHPRRPQPQPAQTTTRLAGYPQGDGTRAACPYRDAPVATPHQVPRTRGEPAHTTTEGRTARESPDRAISSSSPSTTSVTAVVVASGTRSGRGPARSATGLPSGSDCRLSRWSIRWRSDPTESARSTALRTRCPDAGVPLMFGGSPNSSSRIIHVDVDSVGPLCRLLRTMGLDQDFYVGTEAASYEPLSGRAADRHARLAKVVRTPRCRTSDRQVAAPRPVLADRRSRSGHPERSLLDAASPERPRVRDRGTVVAGPEGRVGLGATTTSTTTSPRPINRAFPSTSSTPGSTATIRVARGRGSGSARAATPGPLTCPRRAVPESR